MAPESALGNLSAPSAPSLGVFRGVEAARLGVTRNQLTALVRAGVITRELPDTYRMSAVARSNDQRLRAALLWAGKDAAAAGRSAGENIGFESYLHRFGRPGRPEVGPLRELLRDLDPKRASRSTLEVKTRRLLASSDLAGFTREFPLDWCGRTYLFDFAFAFAFAFEREHTILETNGRRWHDYERDNEKWSVPGRHGWRIVFATWSKVTEHPRLWDPNPSR